MLKVTDSWVNLNRGSGDYNKLHQHLPALFSGVYYAQPPRAETGRFNGAFVLPLTTVGKEGVSGAGAAERSQSEVTFALMRPAPGMLMLFPAAMLHAVLPTYYAEGAEAEERISIGFNVSPGW